jgi:uncharacterized protein YgiB involved in biofilm formation
LKPSLLSIHSQEVEDEDFDMEFTLWIKFDCASKVQIVNSFQQSNKVTWPDTNAGAVINRMTQTVFSYSQVTSYLQKCFTW